MARRSRSVTACLRPLGISRLRHARNRSCRHCIFALLTLLCLAPLLPAPSAHASSDQPDFSLSINPSNQDLELTPGQTFEGKIMLYNLGQSELDFTVEVSPYQILDNSYAPDFTRANSYTNLSNWITLAETSYHTIANGYAQIDFTIQVPEDAPGGGQYAAILIRPAGSEVQTAGLGIIPQVASILYGHVSGAESKLEGGLLSVDFPSLMLGDFRTKAVFSNTGNIDYRVTETLSIREFFSNRELLSTESKTSTGITPGYQNVTVLPGTNRTVTMQWEAAPEIGIFKATQSIYYLDQEEIIEKLVIICPLWLVIAITIIIVLIIVWVILILVNRKHSKPQVY